MTVAEIVKFIVTHRKGKAFYKWTVEEIAACINQCIEDNSISVALSGDRIVGVITANVHRQDKVLYITNILAIQKGVIGPFMALKNILYPEYKIEGLRNGKRKIFSSSLIKRFRLKGI